MAEEGAQAESGKRQADDSGAEPSPEGAHSSGKAAHGNRSAKKPRHQRQHTGETYQPLPRGIPHSAPSPRKLVRIHVQDGLSTTTVIKLSALLICYYLAWFFLAPCKRGSLPLTWRVLPQMRAGSPRGV
jgi:hypothetical protein